MEETGGTGNNGFEAMQWINGKMLPMYLRTRIQDPVNTRCSMASPMLNVILVNIIVKMHMYLLEHKKQLIILNLFLHLDVL